MSKTVGGWVGERREEEGEVGASERRNCTSKLSLGVMCSELPKTLRLIDVSGVVLLGVRCKQMVLNFTGPDVELTWYRSQ